MTLIEYWCNPAKWIVPIVILGWPVVASAQTVSKTLSVTTDEPATCHGCQEGVGGCSDQTEYDAMGFTFEDAGGNVHEFDAENLACNASFVFWVRCRDSTNNTSNASAIRFSIDALVLDDGGPTPDGGGDPGTPGGDPGSTGDEDPIGGEPAPAGEPDPTPGLTGGCTCSTASTAGVWSLLPLLLVGRRRRS